MSNTPIGFDYSSISAEQARWVLEQSKAISTQIRHCSAAVVDIGRRLIEVREVLGAIFVPWINAEFQWSVSTARGYMAAAERFSDVDGLENIQPTAMVELSRNKTPQSAVVQAVAMARDGVIVSKAVAIELISKHTIAQFAENNRPFALGAATPAPPCPSTALRKVTRFVDSLKRFLRDASEVTVHLSDTERKSLAEELTRLSNQILSVPARKASLKPCDAAEDSVPCEARQSRTHELAAV